MKNRRDFIKSIAVAGAASGMATRGYGVTASPTQLAQASGQKLVTSAMPPNAGVQAMEDESILNNYSAAEAERYFIARPGSDFMIDVVNKLGIDFIAANPGSSFRGFQESAVSYGKNSLQWLTALHEESSVAMGHGYAKIAHKPMAMALHGTVGLQHAAMAVYNAFCDRAPLIIFAGNHLDATQRRLGTEWAHTVQDTAKIVRDFIKWDDTPVSLPHFAESTVRAYKLAMTPPYGPVVITIDGHLQEMDIGNQDFRIPDMSPTLPPQGDDGALREAAGMLVNAERPVIIADYMARTPEGIDNLIELAETLQIPVVDIGGRMNFPNTHYLNQTGEGSRLVREADVILGLEVWDFFGEINRVRDGVHRDTMRRARDDAKLIHIGVNDLFIKSNYQYFQRYQPVDMSIAGDAQVTLPDLSEAIRRQSNGMGSRLSEREEMFRKSHQQIRERSRQAAVYGWDMSPVSLPRIYMELWQQIKDRDWSLLSRGHRWNRDLWTVDKHYHNIGYSGGRGVGYVAPAAAGGALANREQGRLSLNIQPDGDLMYAPGILWTTAHHEIPLLSIVHNNRSYQREVMHLQRMASRRHRDMHGSSAEIGNVLEDPNIDYAGMAKGMGIQAQGPIDNPHDLGPAIARAIDIIDQGEPALIDVISQPR